MRVGSACVGALCGTSAGQGSFVTSAAGWKSEISVLGVVAIMNVTGVAGCRLESSVQ